MDTDKPEAPEPFPKSAAFASLVEATAAQGLAGLLSHAYSYAGDEARAKCARAILDWCSLHPGFLIEDYHVRTSVLPRLMNDVLDRYATDEQKGELAAALTARLVQELKKSSNWEMERVVRQVAEAAAERELSLADVGGELQREAAVGAIAKEGR